jgi:hypothetical protein
LLAHGRSVLDLVLLCESQKLRWRFTLQVLQLDGLHRDKVLNYIGVEFERVKGRWLAGPDLA